MVSGHTELQVPSCLRRAGEEGPMLRQHPDNEERPRFPVLRRESEIRGRGNGSGGRRRLLSDSHRQRE